MLLAVAAPRDLLESFNEQPVAVPQSVYPRSEAGLCPDYGKDFMSCTPVGERYCQCSFH